MPRPIPLCTLAELPEGSSRGFQCGELNLFAVRRGGRVHLFRNSCPHLGVELNWNDDQFLTSDGSLIQCATHGALFEIDGGRCVAGPCRGKHLTPQAFQIENEVLVALVSER